MTVSALVSLLVVIVLLLVAATLVMAWALAISAKREDARLGYSGDPASVGKLVAELRARKEAEGHLVHSAACRYYDGEEAITTPCAPCAEEHFRG